MRMRTHTHGTLSCDTLSCPSYPDPSLPYPEPTGRHPCSVISIETLALPVRSCDGRGMDGNVAASMLMSLWALKRRRWSAMPCGMDVTWIACAKAVWTVFESTLTKHTSGHASVEYIVGWIPTRYGTGECKKSSKRDGKTGIKVDYEEWRGEGG
jgi:hypothetical protein